MSDTQELDLDVLLAARSGELEAISSLYTHYRERLMTLAGNAGAEKPVPLVQNAITQALLAIEPDEFGIEEFERDLFARVMADLLDTGELVDETGPIDLADPDPDPDPEPFVAPPAVPAPPVDPGAAGEPTIQPAATDGEPAISPAPGAVLPVTGEVPVGPAGPTLPSAATPVAEPSVMSAAAPVATAATAVAPMAGDPLLDTAQIATGELDEGATAVVVLDDGPGSGAGPVDWNELPSPPVLDEPRRAMLRRFGAGLLAGGCAAALGVAGWFLLTGDDDVTQSSTSDPLPAQLSDGDAPDAADGSASSAPSDAEGDRSVVTVTADPGSTVSVSTTAAPSSTVTTADPGATTLTSGATSSSTTAPSTTATTAPPTSAPSTTTTAPSTTTTVEETTTTTRQTTTTRAEGDFSGQELQNVSFRGDNLRGYDFSNAVLKNVVFSRASIRGVDFSGASLINVRFTNSDLTNANLRDTLLDNVDLENTNISGVDFTGAELENGEIDGYWFSGNPPINLPDDDD